MNYLGGFRNTMTMVLTGLNIEDKASWAVEQLFELLGGQESFDDVDVQLLRYDKPDPPASLVEATAHLRVTVKDRDRVKVDRAFSNSVVELAVAGYPGFHTTTPPGAASEFGGVYWPTLVPASVVEHVVVHADNSREVIPPHSVCTTAAALPNVVAPSGGSLDFGPTTRRPLARSSPPGPATKGGATPTWVSGPTPPQSDGTGCVHISPSTACTNWCPKP